MASHLAHQSEMRTMRHGSQVLAMQKVVGSSPIIRSPEPAGNGGFCRRRARTQIP